MSFGPSPIPAWIVPEQWRELKPPPEVLDLSKGPRSAEKLLEISEALCVTRAARYRPEGRKTWCNIYLADVCALLRAPLPHVFDLRDGKGERELRANDIAWGLEQKRFPKWQAIGTVASTGSICALAEEGRPVVAVWHSGDSDLPGHVVLCVPALPGRGGIYVTGAGRNAIERQPISWAFSGATLPKVQFYTHP